MHVTLTPTRGDRPEFKQIIKQIIAGFECTSFINGHNTGLDYDLTMKVRSLCESYEKWGEERTIKTCSIIEDDDYYPAKYVEFVKDKLKSFDIVAADWTYYYHLKTRKWIKHIHKGRASLFTTSFKLKCLEGFNWPPDDYIFLDLKMWEHFRKKKFRVYWFEEKEMCPVGIKHNIGVIGGNGHVTSHYWKNTDEDLTWLRNKVDDDFIFNSYVDISKKLRNG